MALLALLTRTLVTVLLLSTALTSAAPQTKKPKPKSGGKGDVKSKEPAQGPITVTTEKSADCNEFPDPGYGGSDLDTYKFWPEASKIKVNCYMDATINGLNYTYLRSTSGCYIDEMSIQAGSQDFTTMVPKCAPPKPYQVYTTKSEYLLQKNGFWMNCFMGTKKGAQKLEVQWGARHVSCSVEGETVGGDNIWWRDSHAIKGEDEHCYVPNDAFDNMVYEISGAGKKCEDLEKKKDRRGLLW